ncbi:helix-turn-helix domain-containing protein [Methylobacterium sp. W2]|nr:helix-turn-helix domain-containing protein [Methylobacterium sp. W2]
MASADHPLCPVFKAAGSAALLARKMGVTPQAVHQWRKIPPLRVLEVERITGISRSDLRPDLYPIAKGAKSGMAGVSL